MNGLAICAGIGGIELGLRLAIGELYKTVCYVEREAFAAAVIVARMEDKMLDFAPVWDDLQTFDGTIWRGKVDIITAGFPCQPWSVAGKRSGRDDDRWIWPGIVRIIREIRPGFVLFENVPGLIRGGLGPVLASLAELGFDAEWDTFRASDVEAPHRRERLFILAYAQINHRRTEQPAEKAGGRRSRSSGISDELADGSCRGFGELRESSRRHRQSDGCDEDVTNASSGGRTRRDFQGTRTARTEACESTDRSDTSDESSNGGKALAHAGGAGCEGLRPSGQEKQENGGVSVFPPGPNERERWAEILERNPSLEPAVCGMVDGISSRVDRLRALGNAVVPAVAAIAWRVLSQRFSLDSTTES